MRIKDRLYLLASSKAVWSTDCPLLDDKGAHSDQSVGIE